MRIRPEYDFSLLHQWPDGIVFEFWTNLCTFTQFWELKWSPFGHLRSDLEKVGDVRCAFVQSMILVCFTKWPDSIVFEFWTNLCTLIQFWELKWPPFSYLGSHLEKVADVRCVFIQSMILVCFTKWPDGIVFEFWTNLCTFTQFWELKWPPFGHLGPYLEKVGDVRCVFVQSMISVCFTNGQTALFFSFGQIYAHLRNFGN